MIVPKQPNLVPVTLMLGEEMGSHLPDSKLPYTVCGSFIILFTMCSGDIILIILATSNIL